MQKRSYDIVFTLALFTLYTVSALLLAAIGASVYEKISTTLTTDYDQRTSVLYVAEKLRQNDQSDAVRTETLAGSDALVLTERVNGETFETWLYVSDGYLKEAVLAPGTAAAPELGQSIMPMKSVRFDGSRLDKGLIGVQFVTADGQTTGIELYLKSSQNHARMQGFLDKTRESAQLVRSGA